jgi:acyl transferase domain-containing protein
LRASVNSFGFGGTNAHVVLETFHIDSNEDKQHTSHTDEGRFIGPLLFSANSKDSLVQSVQAHADYVRNNEGLDLEDLTYTLESRRQLLVKAQRVPSVMMAQSFWVFSLAKVRNGQRWAVA